ncbi:MAG: GatB/YqeY domain-containing protein [Thioploca sp.]|nr:GatB/YqeY domain-containing protein [Thioploca sp.]
MAEFSIKEKITEDMKVAMRAKEKQRLGVIRLIQAAIKQREVDERISLDDTQVIVVLDKMLKQRRDSIEQYEKAGRQDLVDQEAFEIQVIKTYLPQPLTETELANLITHAIQATGATTVKDLGKVMGILKAQVQGRADMKQLSDQIKQRLNQ